MSVSKASAAKAAKSTRSLVIGDLTTDQLSALISSAVIDALILQKRVDHDEKGRTGELLSVTKRELKEYITSFSA